MEIDANAAAVCGEDQCRTIRNGEGGGEGGEGWAQVGGQAAGERS
jgi:hypothetical protein